MSEPLPIACPEQKGPDKYGYVRQHKVYAQPFAQPGQARCEACGGVQDLATSRWTWTCSMCHQQQPQGSLCGLFVPHACRPCLNAFQEQEREKGHVCRFCWQVYSACCC